VDWLAALATAVGKICSTIRTRVPDLSVRQHNPVIELESRGVLRWVFDRASEVSCFIGKSTAQELLRRFGFVPHSQPENREALVRPDKVVIDTRRRDE
jgi:hypothetical protein